VKAGAIIPAALLTGIDTARAGPVVASVTQNVFDTVTGRHLLVPQGARLIGRHDGESQYGDRRAFLAWDRLILPNGRSVLLSKEPGVDAQGAVGVRGRIDRRLGALAIATLFAGAITTLGEIARDDGAPGGFWADAGDAASIEAARVGGRLIDRELEVRPSIRLEAGAPVRVMITRDLILEPYRP
jgi:type IV secretion system protein VirB10